VAIESENLSWICNPEPLIRFASVERTAILVVSSNADDGPVISLDDVTPMMLTYSFVSLSVISGVTSQFDSTIREEVSSNDPDRIDFAVDGNDGVQLGFFHGVPSFHPKRMILMMPMVAPKQNATAMT